MHRRAAHTAAFVFCILIALTLFFPATPSGKARAHDGDRDGDRDSRVQLGFELAPVPLNLDGKNRALVGYGSYIVNAMAPCAECHSNPTYAPGGNPYLGQPAQLNITGYLAGGQAFGPFLSRNITPERGGLPAGLTLDQFISTIRTGVDPDHLHPQISPLLQVMPWPAFRHMTDRDLHAIYEYLRSIPCVEGGPGEPPNRC